MKKTMRRMLALAIMATTLVAGSLPVSAVTSLEDVAQSDKQGSGAYTIEVHNGPTTGIDIEGDWFHAYQLFETSDVTSYDVAHGFEDFFSGDDKIAGDGSHKVFDFQTQLDIINDATATQAEKDAALLEYNQMAGLYMDTYKNNMYDLAIQIREYLEVHGHYNLGTANSVTCVAHSQAVRNSDGSQTARLVGLDPGYYFVMDQNNTVNGLGIAASGGFVPIRNGQADTIITIEVKESVPTVTKQIYHNDKNAWDVVGDHEIGDTVEFLVTSTLPSNIDDYASYTYRLTDSMSEGITYNGDVKLFTDFECSYEVPRDYLTINNTPSGDIDFVVELDAKRFMADYPQVSTLYTYYTGVLNYSAVVAKDHDSNTITLEYSNNPSDADQTGSSESTVFHYTFALNVNKVDENLNGLAGARFGIFDDNGDALKLQEVYTDFDTGIVYYCYAESAAEITDGGYITTREVTLNDGSTVIGRFKIYGLDDAETYTLREVEAPGGYNAVDDISFIFTPSYTTTGSGITSLTDGNGYIHTVNFESETTIMNRKTIFLPSTGGVGTVLFQVGGGALMLGAAAMLLMNHRKKEEK